jgi:hypothetical protein
LIVISSAETGVLVIAEAARSAVAPAGSAIFLTIVMMYCSSVFCALLTGLFPTIVPVHIGNLTAVVVALGGNYIRFKLNGKNYSSKNVNPLQVRMPICEENADYKW